MAVCQWCNQDMTATVACTEPTYTIEGETFARIPYDPDYATTGCHDCGTPRGGLHHPGCDMERCPKCGGQAIGCDCDGDDEDEPD